MKIEKIIYADNAATTKLDIEAFEAMKRFLLEDYANASQHYSFSSEVKKALKASREAIAKCINASLMKFILLRVVQKVITGQLKVLLLMVLCGKPLLQAI